MHFARTEEQDELARMLAGLLAKRSDSAAMRSAMASPDGFDSDLWRTLCEQVGVAALPVPEQYDGAGASLVESAIALEEIGYALTPSPLLAVAIATSALLLNGTDEQRAALLPRIAGGEVATVLDDLTLDGTAATIRLRFTDQDLAEADDITLTGAPTMDPLLRLARGGSPGRPWPEPVRHVATALVTAEQLGVARRGLDMTTAYTKEREQFGRPIGSFQAIKHRLADLLVLVEASTSASWAATAAAAAYVEGLEDAGVLARRTTVAKAYVSDALHQVASETMQLHGGIAITWEHDAQLLFKRAHALGQLFGSAREHRRALGDLL